MNLRRVLRWGLGVGALVALLAIAFGGWVLRSAGGRDWVLARVVASLPAGSTLQWRTLDGRVSGPLVVHGLDYTQADGLRVQVETLRIDHSVWPLLARRWQVRQLRAEGVRVLLPRDDTPFEWPRWPEVLPSLDLPLAISVADLQVRRLALLRADAPPLQLDHLRAALTLGAGELSLRKLDTAGPTLRAAGTLEYRPRENYRTRADLTLQGLGPDLPAGTALHLIARGDLDAFTASLDGRAPQAVSLRLQLRDGRGTPAWRADLRTDGLQPALLGLADAATWQGVLRIDGRGGVATLAGTLDRDGTKLTLDGSRVQADAHGLAFAPGQVGLAQGAVRLSGRVDFSARPATLALRAASDRLRLAATTAGGADVLAAGTIDLRGTLDRWTLAGDLQLARGKERATVALHGTGDGDALRLDRVQARMPSGRLDGSAALQWSPALGARADLRLAGFDPGYFAPDFPGALDGRITLDAQRTKTGWQGVLGIPALSGRLRGRALQGQADARWRDDRGEGALTLSLGASRLQASGRFGARLDLRASAQPLDLADLWPDARGRLRGTLALRGPRAAPELEADLAGQDLRWGDYAARSLRLRGRLPDAPARGRVDADAAGLVVGGQAFDHASVQLQGHRRAFSVQARLEGGPGRLDFAGDATHAGASWQGHLQQLQVAPARGPAWRLQAPIAWGHDADGLRFGRACLRELAGAGQACAQLARDSARVDGQGLAIALVEPWLGAGLADYEGFGVVGFDGQFDRVGTQWNGQLRLHSSEGGVRLRATPATPLLAYRELQLRLALRGGRLQADGDAQLSGGGSLRLQGAGGLDADAPLAATLALDLRDLAWMELLSPDLAAPSGRVQGTLRLAGTRAAPRIGGEANLVGFRGELPALGVDVRDGSLRLAGEPGGTLSIQGSLRAGDGVLAINGGLDLRQQHQPLLVALTGDNLRVADTPDLQASISPRLQLRYLDGELQLRGSVLLPSARVNLERVERGVAPSRDVVVLDPRTPTAGGGLVFDTLVTVQVGEDVRLRGFGLDGTLGGELAIRDQPGRPPTANGSLAVSGRYRAYGRDLSIRRARLTWVNAAYDNPVLDVLAEHEFEDVTVGVRVRGTAQAPQTSVTSAPAMSTAEALSWLLLGRPLETASGTETQRISASAVALSAGSSLLAQRLGVQLGLDSAGIVENRALGGSTLVVGKRLSPRLFVSYGVSLLGTGQVVMLKYLLKRGLSLGLESGTVETAASLDWRKEK